MNIVPPSPSKMANQNNARRTLVRQEICTELNFRLDGEPVHFVDKLEKWAFLVHHWNLNVFFREIF